MTSANNLLAAIDLGSNSFRLTIMQVEESTAGHLLKPVDDIKETVRLAAGLDEKQRLSDEAKQRAFSALERFAERIRGFEKRKVRAVGTSTMRIAKNIDDFLPEAIRRLHFPIEVISGHEEARLIYVGAANTLPPTEDRRLVIDIGGGSTECIVGQSHNPILLDSARVGCLSTTKACFINGRLNRDSFDKAYIMAKGHFASFSGDYKRLGWKQAWATSGTARSVLQVIRERIGIDRIERDALKTLRDEVLGFSYIEEISYESLREDRKAVYPGGLATLMAAMDEFEIRSMGYCGGALREGLVHDLLGRQQDVDLRDLSIAGLAKRHGVDLNQATRVATLARELFGQLVSFDQEEMTENVFDPQSLARLIQWAAQIHEIGLVIGHDHYHKHSAYVVEHAEIAGFSQTEQHNLGLLLLSHRGKLAKILALSPERNLLLAIVSLRLAVLLHRRRDERQIPIKLELKSNRLTITLPQDWLDQHALSNHLLTTECNDWNRIGAFKEFRLKADVVPPVILPFTIVM
jgi:exopolyphosphatase / guanosine-5'-triphosphate,3'-diphosphate pyrophosphatase